MIIFFPFFLIFQKSGFLIFEKINFFRYGKKRAKLPPYVGKTAEYFYVHIYREKYLALCASIFAQSARFCTSLNRKILTWKNIYFSFYQKTKTTFVTLENHENDLKKCSEGIREYVIIGQISTKNRTFSSRMEFCYII